MAGTVKIADLPLSESDRKIIRLTDGASNVWPIWCGLCEEVHVRFSNEDGSICQLGACGFKGVKAAPPKQQPVCAY